MSSIKHGGTCAGEDSDPRVMKKKVGNINKSKWPSRRDGRSADTLTKTVAPAY